jgi:predicted ArsR family transcriptional regulator
MNGLLPEKKAAASSEERLATHGCLGHRLATPSGEACETEIDVLLNVSSSLPIAG